MKRLSPDEILDGVVMRERIRAAKQWRRAGYRLSEPAVAELVNRGLPPIEGGAVGEIAAKTYQGVPVDEFFVISPELFNQATILNTWQSPLKAIPGPGNSDSFQIPGRGLMAMIELVFTGTVTSTPGTGTVTATDRWPYGLLSKIALNVNGSPLLSAGGLAYEWRRKLKSRNAPDSQTSAPLVAGANVTEIHWLIPISEDMVNLDGALLSQADDLYIGLDYTQEALNNLVTLTGNATLAIAGNLQLNYYAFDVPILPVGQQQKGVLPDLDIFHRLSEYAVPVVANGDTEIRIQQTGGMIERVFLAIDNTLGSFIDPASWSRVRIQFAETEEPLTLPANVLLSQNARHYNGRIAPKCAVLDFTAWNAQRDAVYPKGVANPKVIVTLPPTITPNAGARALAVQESLIANA